MRQTTSLRLVALFLAVASTTGMATVAAAQSASDRTPAVATSSAEANRAGANGVQANGGEAFRSTGNTTATESRSVLLDRRAAGLTRVASDETTREAPMPRQENNSRTNTALMIVGAAAVVLGAAIGDEAGTVLIIGGAGIGLFGLYRWLN